MKYDNDAVPSAPLDQFSEPAAWQVWWGLVDMRPEWPPYRTKAEAEAKAARIKSNTDVRPLWATAKKLPALPKPRVLASITIAGKHTEMHGWHTDDIETWERQHGLKFGA